MSVAAVMLVKDEADIIESILRHLLDQVDQVLVADNLSTDDTYEIVDALRAEFGGARLQLGLDEEVGYFQSRKTTELAMRALELGHQWVVPCDADEVWYATDRRRVADWLSGLARDVMYVQAPMHHHLPTALDPPIVCPDCGDRGWVAEPGPDPSLPNQVACQVGEPNPLLRIGHRQREHGDMGKVACRLRPDLVIHAGNHSAWAPGPGLTIKGGLSIRHFPWRSPEQYLRKIRNGEVAYAATDLPEGTGAHWRQFAGKPDEAITGWFWTWGYSANPAADETLIYDPAPVSGQLES